MLPAFLSGFYQRIAVQCLFMAERPDPAAILRVLLSWPSNDGRLSHFSAFPLRLPHNVDQTSNRFMRGAPTTLAIPASVDSANRRPRDRCR
jgi:hypothetical protein